MFNAIGAFLGRLRRRANFWRISPLEGVRTGSPLAGGLMFLVALLSILALALTLLGWIFGFTLDDVDSWLARIGPPLDFIGKVLIQKVLMAVVLFFCVVGGAALLLDRKGAQRPGWLATILILLVCLFVGYCSTVNMVAPLR